MWAGKHGEGEGEGGRAILEGWAAGRQEVYTSVFLYFYIYIDTLYRHNWLLHNGLTSVGNAKKMRQREYRQKK